MQFMDLIDLASMPVALDSTYPARCARGNNFPIDNFYRDEDSNIVFDGRTGLIWTDTESSMILKFSWLNAIDYCANLTLGGYNDWRLPNTRELMSIIDKKIYEQMFYPVFKYSSNEYYWTSLYANVFFNNLGIAYNSQFGFNAYFNNFTISGSDYNLDGNYDEYEFDMNVPTANLMCDESLFQTTTVTTGLVTATYVTIPDNACSAHVKCVR